MRHRPKGSTKIRSANHSNRPENGEAKDRQQSRYRRQTDIKAQVGAEQNRRKVIERHRKETPQRHTSQQSHKSLGAKPGNRQSPTTAMLQQESQSSTPDNEETPPPPRAESRIHPSQQSRSRDPIRATAIPIDYNSL